MDSIKRFALAVASTMFVFAAIHMVALHVLALTQHNLKYIDLFYVLDIDLIIPGFQYTTQTFLIGQLIIISLIAGFWLWWGRRPDRS